MKFIFLLSLPLYIVDQVTKKLILTYVDPSQPPPEIVPQFLHFVNVTNTGAAFGSFRGNNTFFVVLSCFALLVVVFYSTGVTLPIFGGTSRSLFCLLEFWGT